MKTISCTHILVYTSTSFSILLARAWLVIPISPYPHPPFPHKQTRDWPLLATPELLPFDRLFQNSLLLASPITPIPVTTRMSISFSLLLDFSVDWLTSSSILPILCMHFYFDASTLTCLPWLVALTITPIPCQHLSVHVLATITTLYHEGLWASLPTVCTDRAFYSSEIKQSISGLSFMTSFCSSSEKKVVSLSLEPCGIPFIQTRLPYFLYNEIESFFSTSLPIEPLMVRSTGSRYPNPGPDRVC